MRFKRLILLLIIFANSAGGFAQHDFSPEQQKFVDSLLPFIGQVNAEISKQRVGIYNIYVEFKSFQSLSPEKFMLIYNYLKLYRCILPTDTLAFSLSSKHFKLLLKKIDIIPPKLVMAQAVTESQWGEAAMAAKGNNYFGILCSRESCGMTIKQVHGPGFFYKSYPSIIDGVRDYMLLLNSGEAFEGFRDLRVANRLNAELPDPFDLVKGLKYYSVYGQSYINNLLRIMNDKFSFL